MMEAVSRSGISSVIHARLAPCTLSQFQRRQWSAMPAQTNEYDRVEQPVPKLSSPSRHTSFLSTPCNLSQLHQLILACAVSVSRPSGTQSGVLDVHPADSRFACLQYIIYQQILQVPQLKLLLKPTLSTAVETAWLAAGFNRSDNRNLSRFSFLYSASQSLHQLCTPYFPNGCLRNISIDFFIPHLVHVLLFIFHNFQRAKKQNHDNTFFTFFNFFLIR